MSDLFSGLITSKTRIRLLLRFFLNAETSAYLRELSNEFNVSSNSVREELNQLTKTNLLTSQKSGRQIFYKANPEHPLFPELRSMVRKVMGVDQVIDGILIRLGELKSAYLIDDYAEGKDTGIIDLLLVGDINHNQLNDLSGKVEKYINRKIRTLVMSQPEFFDFGPKLKLRPNLLIWKQDGADH
ncbi:MAG: transcriptional regulator [Desulfobacterales bacterium CG23_combo_of_CG06-09_8_20_14_all_51_8]|nr:MAG: transcriptional regulator [Desulfobacterales bacterium CG23_combo_of_CG06-09_8_20_14_all_51_8]